MTLMADFDIKHVASLAHLSLNEDEAKKFQEQISSILEYVGKLNEVDTRSVEPTAHITGVTNAMREDEVRACAPETREVLLKNAPQKEGDYIKVKPVFQ